MINWDFEFACDLCRRHFAGKAKGKQVESWHAGKMERRMQEVVDYHWAMGHPGPAFGRVVERAPAPEENVAEG